MDLQTTVIHAAVNMAESKPIVIAAVSGFAASQAFGLGAAEAIQFGAVSALATSAVDTITTAFGYNAKLDSYLSPEISSYFDAGEFAAGAVGTMGVRYFLGDSGRPLTEALVISGLSAAVAPALSGAIVKSLMNPKKDGSDLPDAPTSRGQTHR